jgi:hypothetical protein
VAAERVGTVAPPQALAPLLSGLVADALPLDLRALEQGLQRFLQQLQEIGRQVIDWEQRGLSSWVFAVAVAAIAGEVARRQLRPATTGPASRRGGPWIWSPL